ncbi:MAG: GNAT family N-acetyltransferase, partial [Candidatus Omnitrophica bacterium]|nr:GNAT family N-acetyltransferase [Candidatus Omnitrophota bacterium]
EFPKERASFPIDDLDDISSCYGKLGEAFFVALDHGKVIGTVAVKQEDARTAMLRRLFVDSKHRRQKIGFQLVDRAIEFCREVGYDELIFKTTSNMNSAVQLCEKKGFVPKAKLNLGQVQLLKFALFLKNESVLPQSKTISS